MAELHLWMTYAIILATVFAYTTDRYSPEHVALASLATFLLLFGLVPHGDPAAGGLHPEELLTGFANPALATVMALLIVGQGLFATDAMDKPARIIARSGGKSNTRTIAITLVTAGALSAFLNNTPVVVIFIPVLTVLAAQRGFAASKALMPPSSAA
jgi:Na+/H+ antiporter NhaD/arsenite permease-like protein